MITIPELESKEWLTLDACHLQKQEKHLPVRIFYFYDLFCKIEIFIIMRSYNPVCFNEMA